MTAFRRAFPDRAGLGVQPRWSHDFGRAAQAYPRAAPVVPARSAVTRESLVPAWCCPDYLRCASFLRHRIDSSVPSLGPGRGRGAPGRSSWCGRLRAIPPERNRAAVRLSAVRGRTRTSQPGHRVRPGSAPRARDTAPASGRGCPSGERRRRSYRSRSPIASSSGSTAVSARRERPAAFTCSRAGSASRPFGAAAILAGAAAA